MSKSTSLYNRLGGYDAIAAVVHNLLPRLMADTQLERFWNNRGKDGIEREKQLLIDYLCTHAGGTMVYTGRDNKSTHRGMGISNSDWDKFISHLNDTLSHFQVAQTETNDVLAFIESTKADIVD
jgi:hemoglobin